MKDIYYCSQNECIFHYKRTSIEREMKREASVSRSFLLVYILKKNEGSRERESISSNNTVHRNMIQKKLSWTISGFWGWCLKIFELLRAIRPCKERIQWVFFFVWFGVYNECKNRNLAGCFSKIVSTPLPLPVPVRGNPKPQKSPRIHFFVFLRLKLCWAWKCLPKLPVWWNNVEKSLSDTICCGNLERQRLAVHIRIGLPISSPIPRHSHPISFWPLDLNRLDWSSSSNIADQN